MLIDGQFLEYKNVVGQSLKKNVLSIRHFLCFDLICFTLENLGNVFNANSDKNGYFMTVFYK